MFTVFVRRVAMLIAACIAVLPALAGAAEPTNLRIAVVLSAGLESGWDGTLIQALERVKSEKPHGLDITWKYTDPLWGDDAGEAMRLLAESGQYDIIWGHSSYSDQVKKLQSEFPDILFVVAGSGNEGLGGNQYLVYKRVHEPAYLLGVIAGNITKSNKLGAVGTYPADDINDAINAYFAGAKSVNPKIERTVAFIESWYDPAKASEYTSAQIATGADVIFQLAGNFKPCEEAKIVCFGNFDDQQSYSPTTVLSSTVALWDPDVKRIIDAWWAFKTEGKPYAGNTDKLWASMKKGGATLAPYGALESTLSPEVRDQVEALKAKMLDGSFEVPIDISDPKKN